MEFKEMYETARALTDIRVLSEFVEVGRVAAVLVTDRGSVYTGVNMDIACGIGFCAEHAAAADMVKHGENRVVRMIAVNANGRIMAPCGRCRELINQLGDNRNCEVMVAEHTVVKLSELLPHDWRG